MFNFHKFLASLFPVSRLKDISLLVEHWCIDILQH